MDVVAIEGVHTTIKFSEACEQNIVKQQINGLLLEKVTITSRKKF